MASSLFVGLHDPHSYAKPEEARVTHLDLNLRLDFEKKVIQGRATLIFETSSRAEYLTLDTRQLFIHSVRSGDDALPLPFSLSSPDDVLGQALLIRLRPGIQKVVIEYETAPDAPALQWLSAEQTAGGREPFFYTQSQAILCRSWIPLQDSPGIRFTYTARVVTKPGHLALMSAQNPQKLKSDGVYEFRMDHPVPAYLLALASGRLDFGVLDHNVGVYAEPEILPQALKDFEDTPRMLRAAEKLYGPYPWGRYDILVMPPSFPFGGMENPCLTFATPTILTGDKSLTSLVAHELAHSWSGNLATNATWNDFWLNEGFTVYLERRIIEELYGSSYRGMLEVLGYEDLIQTIEALKEEGREEDTRLRLHLDNRDPDEGMNDIAYEKGYLFLRSVERLIGTQAMDQMLQEWFRRHAFKSVTTASWMEFLKEQLSLEQWAAVQPDKWILEPFLPLHAAPQSRAFQEVEEAVFQFLNDIDKIRPVWGKWNSHQRQHFLRKLSEQKPTPKDLAALDASLELNESTNFEELFIWFMMALKAGYMDVLPRLDEFLSSVGRRKFVLPLVRQLACMPALKDWARKRFLERWKLRYHYVTASSCESAFSKD